MGWVRDRVSALDAAWGPKRYMLAPLFGAVVGFVDWVVTRLSDAGMGALIGVPSWAIGVLATLLLASWWLLEYIVRLRRKIAPQLKIGFSETAGCLVSTPIKKIDALGNKVDEWKSIYIRGMVEVESGVEVRNCSAYLVEVTKKTNTGVYVGTQYIDDLQLAWSNAGIREINIPTGIRRFFDIVNIDEREGKPRVAREWPLTLRGLFDDPTAYRLKLVVSGEGISKTMFIEFEWGPKIDQVQAKMVE